MSKGWVAAVVVAGIALLIFTGLQIYFILTPQKEVDRSKADALSSSFNLGVLNYIKDKQTLVIIDPVTLDKK